MEAYLKEGRSVTSFTLRTTPQELAMMLEFLKKNPEGGVDRNAFGAQTMIRQNCTTAVCNVFMSAGLIKPGDSPNGALTLFHRPEELKTALSDGGDLSDLVEGEVHYYPASHATSPNDPSSWQNHYRPVMGTDGGTWLNCVDGHCQ